MREQWIKLSLTIGDLLSNGHIEVQKYSAVTSYSISPNIYTTRFQIQLLFVTINLCFNLGAWQNRMVANLIFSEKWCSNIWLDLILLILLILHIYFRQLNSYQPSNTKIHKQVKLEQSSCTYLYQVQVTIT